MIKLNSQYANKVKGQRQINFTFANPKTKLQTIEHNSSELTSSQKRALGMWLETVLQFHSQQFAHALKSCRKYSVADLSNYIKKHYSHLKIIAQFYIIASLIDYQCIIGQGSTNLNVQKQCVFTNIVIEELTTRFFRENQWLQKASYLPIFAIFPLFDSFSKGYTTVNELKSSLKKILLPNSANKPRASGKQKTQRRVQKLLLLKLSSNIDEKDCKIYQQNVQQLMARVNIVVFEENLQMGSRRYLKIKNILDQQQKLTTQRYERNLQQEIIKEIRDKEELQIMRQNFQITFKSNLIIRSNDPAQNQVSAKNQQQLYKDKIPESVFSTRPFSTALAPPKYETIQNINQNEDLLDFQKYEAIYRKDPNLGVDMRLARRAQEQMKQNITFHENMLHQQFVSNNVKQIQINRGNLQYRNSILEQLAVIREEKRSTHFRLLNYV